MSAAAFQPARNQDLPFRLYVESTSGLKPAVSCFGAAGIEFLEENGTGEGVRFRTRQQLTAGVRLRKQKHLPRKATETPQSRGIQLKRSVRVDAQGPLRLDGATQVLPPGEKLSLRPATRGRATRPSRQSVMRTNGQLWNQAINAVDGAGLGSCATRRRLK